MVPYYSNEIPKTEYYRNIANYIAEGRDVIVYGIRCSGKTTLMMQLLVNLESTRTKHYICTPSLEEMKLYLKMLAGRRSILFVDDCFRDTNAVIEALKAGNVQVICFDRDFNFERQFHKIRDFDFVPVDITEISREDAQKILNVIPQDIKKSRAGTKRFQEDPTLLNVLASSVKPSGFNFIRDFYNKDKEAAEVFLMICYVHSCGVPCSFDMVYSYLGDREYNWQQMFGIINRIGGLIRECEDYFGDFDIVESMQDYYKCRSRIFAERIMESIPKGSRIFAEMLMKFVREVPPYKICQYDKFKRSGYDADYAARAFPEYEDGKTYYRECIERDESEYIYQQASIYFWRMNRKKDAFVWIEKARNMANYNRFSIDSTYTQFYFDVNIRSDQTQAEKALAILYNCCTNDKRKAIHFCAFAKRVLEYAQAYPGQGADEYVQRALSLIQEGLSGNSGLALSKKNKWELIGLRRSLTGMELTGYQGVSVSQI